MLLHYVKMKKHPAANQRKSIMRIINTGITENHSLYIPITIQRNATQLKFVNRHSPDMIINDSDFISSVFL